jgi:hypothetical protein
MTQSKTQDDVILAGYKGFCEMDTTVYFAPYVPQGPNLSPWEAFLQRLHANHSLWPAKNKTPQDLIMDANGLMQERWPGPYVVEETYDTKGMKFVYTMVFNSKEDKALFILTHSGS